MELSERAANRDRWQQEIGAWRASGKKLTAWARERNLSRDALEYWKRRIPAVGPSAQRRSPLTLIPVRSAQPETSDVAPIELVDDARPGLRIRLPARFDAVSLGHLLDVLESRC